MKYRLTKLQVKRLLDDKPVVDSRGRKFFASKEVKDALKMVDENNLYDQFDVFMENNALDIIKK